MDIADKAEQSPDVHRIRDAQFSAFKLLDTELVPANDITPEDQFPEFGDFLQTAVSEDSSGPPLYVECPEDLARGLMEIDIEPGDWFRIGEAQKIDGRWSVDVTAGSDRTGDEKS